METIPTPIYTRWRSHSLGTNPRPLAAVSRSSHSSHSNFRKSSDIERASFGCFGFFDIESVVVVVIVVVAAFVVAETASHSMAVRNRPLVAWILWTPWSPWMPAAVGRQSADNWSKRASGCWMRRWSWPWWDIANTQTAPTVAGTRSVIVCPAWTASTASGTHSAADRRCSMHWIYWIWIWFWLFAQCPMHRMWREPLHISGTMVILNFVLLWK